MAFSSTRSRKLPIFVTQEEFEKMFEEIIRKEKRATVLKRNKLRRYRIAMLLGFEAGMRISEIVGLKNANIPQLDKDNLSEISIRIIGKGKKERIVPRPKRLNEAAKLMLPLKISRRALQSFIEKIGNEVLGKHIGFHSLRHGFGSHLAGQGRPLHEIQMLMGHSRLDTTGLYTHCNPKNAVEGARDVF